MEGEGWILQLPGNAHEAHAGALSPPQGAPTKNRHHDCIANPNPEKGGRAIDLEGGESRKRRRIDPNVELLRDRPVLRDVYNDIIDLT